MSLTVTLNDALAVLPAPSVAEQLTVVVPAAKMEPDAGEHPKDVTVENASDAEAE